MPEWFHRFGDIPGVGYTTPAEIDRTKLPGYNRVPRTHEARPTLQLDEWLEWPAADGGRGGSASPVHDHAFSGSRNLRKAPAAALLRHLAEGLELPGEPSDYHFLIQNCIDELWPRGRKEPDLVTEIERLSWLDMTLVQACPDAVSVVTDEKTQYYAIKAFYLLIQLYEGRGDLAKALAVAEVAVTFDQCQDDRERLLWQTGGRDTEPVPAPYAPTPQHANGGRPNQPPRRDGGISDWGFRPSVPDGPFGGDWSYWWDDWCQQRFDELWTDEADRVADALADKYWFHWPWLIGKALITAAPATYERIMNLSQDPHRPGPAHIRENPDAIADEIARWGAFGIVRRHRSWQEPSAAVCPTCGQDFWNGDVSPWAIQAFGPVRYCMDCALRVRNGDPRATWFEHEVKAALLELQATMGRIPPQSFSAGEVPHDGSPAERDRRIRALLAMPPSERVKQVFGQSDWLGVLKAAGLVGETWRPSMGTWCHASDGHRCRSLLEKAMDDWFTSNGLPHQCEPSWPRHESLNPNGAKRADWLLPDGTYVECAGMLESKDYAQKIALKRQLANAVGIPLIVVAPTDMYRLADIFAAHLQRA
jgi:hypothetical protein